MTNSNLSDMAVLILQGIARLLSSRVYTSKSVYHVSEQAFTMSPVYTEGWFTPALAHHVLDLEERR